MINDETLKKLEQRAWQIRLELIKMFSYGKAHHFGGSLSCVEILTALYFYKMKYSKENANDSQRDRFIMSKGHSIPTQYVILAMIGMIPMQELKTIKQIGTRLQGHPDILKTPGVESPTGSLGMGLSFANGLALAARLDDLKFNIYILLGDGELQEGQVWEAAMTSSHYQLANICTIIDRNRFQAQGEVDRLMKVEPLLEKWEAFGWQTMLVDGHDIKQLCKALDCSIGNNEKPRAIVANTIKGKGISFLENNYKYHNNSLTREEYDQAVAELQLRVDSLCR